MHQSKLAKFLLWTGCGFLIFLGFVEHAAGVGMPSPKADKKITAQIQLKIAADPTLTPFHLNITTDGAVVSMKGVVNTTVEAKKLVVLAYSVAGVKSVNVSRILVLKAGAQPAMKSQLKGSPTFSADSILTSLVTSLYIQEGFIDAHHPELATIHVHTKQGIVSLSGSVSQAALATKAIELAQTIPGVVKVQSTLSAQ